MKRKKEIYEVWEEIHLECGEIIYKYVDTFKDITLAIELARWKSSYKIKKLGGNNGGRTNPGM